MRRPAQGYHPAAGRGQAIAPTMDGPGKLIRGIVGATLVVALGWGGLRWGGRPNIELHLLACTQSSFAFFEFATQDFA